MQKFGRFSRKVQGNSTLTVYPMDPHPFQFGFFIHMTLWLPASVVAGWVVARLHKHHRAAVVLGLALILGVFAICNERFYFLVRNSLTHERFVPYLMVYLLGSAVGIAGVLVGGLMQPMTAQRAESNAPPLR
jgi:hypothetical protein